LALSPRHVTDGAIAPSETYPQSTDGSRRRGAPLRKTAITRAVADAVPAVLLAVMFVCFIIQVVMRYVVDSPVGWTVEVCVITWLWVVLVNVMLLALGSLLEAKAILLVIVPIFLPTALALGVDPVHFGVIVVVTR
jgi:TRAP-type C4-dicarboxylate transport system permease large subunit